jgi:hypothetical protein
MVQEAIDGLTDQQIADLELQESGLVSGQNADTIAYTPFAQRMNPQPASAPEPEEPVALSEFQLNQLEEENYRRIDYVMTPQEFDQYWDRRDKEDREVGRFFEGLGQGAAGLIGMVPETGRELQGAMVGMVTDPVNQVQRNVQTGAEIIRKGGINLVQLFDWVGSKVDDLATGSKRAEAINAGIMDRLIADGKMTGNREQDEQIYQAALGEAREAGAYTPTLDQAREDKGKAYERYVREKALERDFANVSEFRTGEGQMSVPTSAGTYQITDEQPMPTISTLGSMVVDPLNALPLGAGALSKARVLRRIANLSEKPLQGAERVASGLADVAERVELGISTRLQDITGLTQKQQAALGAGVAGTAVYVDSATDGGGGITKAVLMAGAVMPALHYGGGLLRKVGSAAGGAATIVREAGVGGLGVARAEAASSLAGNAAVPKRYRKFFTGYVDGTDSTLKRVAQESGNPEALRRMSRFADRMGATQVARAADDVVSGAVTAGIVGSPFAALQPDAERAGEVMGGILALGGVGGLAGGVARRAGTAADADIARMFADVQAVGGNVEAFARLPHATLDRLSAMQGVLAGKVDFVPLTGDEYRMNADIAQNGGEATAGVFLDRDANNRARVFINLDGKTATDAIAPHEIGHAILTSNILDGQPRNDLRNLVNQQYGPEGVEARGREYIARMVDADLRQGATGEAPTVLTEAEMKAMDGGKTMDDIVAERAKDPAERDRLINERVEEFRQRSIDKGEDALDWARDEIIAETFASEAPAIDFRAIRRDALFPRLAESMLSAGGRVLEVMGARLDPGTGKLMDNPSVLFRDNPLFQDRIMQKRVREYVRSYDQYLAGLEEAGAKELRGVELARSSKPEDLARSTHVKLRDEGNGVLENDFLFQKPDGTYSLKPQKIITATENARSAQIKTLYDARKFVPVNSQEFGKRKVNGREVVGGPVLPPQFDFFTHFPQHVREFARSMEQSRAEGGSWDIDYNAIGTGASGRYRVTNLGNVRAIQRETVPFGWQVTKANHLLAASLDLNAFRGSAMKAINKGDLGLFNNDMRQVEADLKTYLANHRNGRPGEMTIGQQKRDMLNGLIGTGTAVQRTANPLYSDLNPRGSIRTWRVDRLNDAKPTGRTGYFFDYDKINNNRMPSALPQTSMAMPDAAPVRTLDTDRLLREYEENQGYLGLSTLGMREGRPVKGGAAETRRLLARNTEISRELDARGVRGEDEQLQRALAKRQRGQAMPDVDARHADLEARYRAGDQGALRQAQTIADDAAKTQGYKVGPVYHWTPEQDFSVFDINKGREGFHFGTKQAAEDRSMYRPGRTIRAFLKGDRAPVRDMMTNNARELFRQLEREGRIKRKVETDYRGATEGVYNEQLVRAADEKWMLQNQDSLRGTRQALSAENERNYRQSVAEVEAKLGRPLRHPMQELQDMLGSEYTVFEYPNKAEDKGSMSYAVTRPEQVKSAEPFTYDDSGRLIPMSRRFDASRPDVRFMPDVADAPPFFLKSSQALDAKIQGKAATPDQVKAILTNPQNGIKAEELKWTGVMQEVERLAKENNGKVPKEALLRYLAEDGAVRFEEVTLRESGTKRNLANEEQLGRLGYSSEVSEDGLVMAFMDLNDPGDMMSAAEMRQFGLPAEAVRLADTIERSFYGSKGSARYGSYQLPGGENYREVVLAMPRQDGGQSMFNVYGPEDRYVKQFKTRAEAEAEVAQNGGRIKELFLTTPDQQNYTSTHFDTPNYVAHMRLNERVDAKGKQGLFIEELQSDRHQQGREKGYKGDANPERDALQAKYDEATAKRNAARDALSNAIMKGAETGKFLSDAAERKLTQDLQNAQMIMETALGELRRTSSGQVPDAPFRTGWPLQLFKRALRDAVADGKEWIGWTTGETQAARYDLSKQVDVLNYDPFNKRLVANKDGNRVIDESVSPEKLPDYIGKEAASRLLDRKTLNGAGNHVLEGNDLKVGGEGMKGFYDTMVPKDVAKYVKQWGAQVEKDGIGSERKVLNPSDFIEWHRAQNPNATEAQSRIAWAESTGAQRASAKRWKFKDVPIWRVNITPQMREGIKKAGQALFVGGVAAVVAEDQLE